MIHTFILQPGLWDGQGKITFSMADDVLDFSMNWTVFPREDEMIHFNQKIDIKAFNDEMHNHFLVSDLTDSTFAISLENDIVGRVEGKGLINPKLIAWEFKRSDQEYEGYEVYELQSDGTYKMHAEFTAGEGLRTQIKGHIKPINTKYLLKNN